MARYFVLARGSKPLPYAGDFPWPYEISLCFDAVARPVGFVVGVGRDRPGTLLTPAEALEPHWEESFVNANGEWLLPFVARLAAGERLDRNEILRLSADTLGREPESYEVAGA